MFDISVTRLQTSQLKYVKPMTEAVHPAVRNFPHGATSKDSNLVPVCRVAGNLENSAQPKKNLADKTSKDVKKQTVDVPPYA
ncbi:unnamed protein product [Ceratitis capitata]|uniref:(Mediterranean fruit fly) hypothetical protein n=1 Tax=Ceratitis capitata TaxID=7213 RepID=A0A811UBY9_CERCA|nr:unnamed protein product [Ceratitis capitata]